MILRPDVPSSPAPPSERREVSTTPTVVDQPPGLGPRETPPSLFETRAPMLRRHDYTHDQSLGQTWRNDGGHVAVGRRRPYPDGRQEESLHPQRPTFRTAPGMWTDPLVDQGDNPEDNDL